MFVRYPWDFDTNRSFGNPFFDYSSKIMPRDRRTAFRWAEVIWNRLDSYRQGLQKIVRYFLTEVEVSGVGAEQVDEWKKLLNRTLNIANVLTLIGDDYLTYGNSITSIVFPFHRFLVCPKCRTAIRSFYMPYTFKDGKFVASCRKCKYRGEFDIYDRRMSGPQRIHVQRWNPHRINLIYNPYSGDRAYIWMIPESFRRRIKQGDRFFLDTTPKEILEAAVNGKNLLLNPSLVKHCMTGNLAGVDSGGWGIPPFLASFGQIWYLQLLKRTNEAMSLDFLIPRRLLTPALPPSAPGSGQDPLRSTGWGMPIFQQKLMELIQKWRTDPTMWAALPFPVQYGPIGGEGMNLIRPDLIEQATGDLLNGMGVPIEFYRGNLKWRGDPQAIRLLEKSWEHLTTEMNSWVAWATDIIAMALGRESVEARLRPPSMFDDVIRKQLLLQLAQQGQVSLKTALSEWNIDTKQERENLIAEQKQQQKELEDAQGGQGMMDLSGAPMGDPGMGAPPVGAPMPAGAGAGPGPGQVPATILGFSQKADELAQYLLSQPSPIRRSQMLELKRSNPALHALTKAKLEEFRGPVDLQGGMAARQQAFGQV